MGPLKGGELSYSHVRSGALTLLLPDLSPIIAALKVGALIEALRLVVRWRSSRAGVVVGRSWSSSRYTLALLRNGLADYCFSTSSVSTASFGEMHRLSL